MNKQKLYEIQISVNGESFLLTKETHSPFVKSDVFALSDYKRSMVTLIGAEGMVLQSGKIFFDCDINENTRVILNGPAPYQTAKATVDFTPIVIPEKTFFQKMLGFFKGETLPQEVFPSSSFICLQDQTDQYHFIGALTEKTHTLSFDVDGENSQMVCKINSQNVPCNHDSVVFDIIEIQGTKDFIIDTFYSLTKSLYKKVPKSSAPLCSTLIGVADCYNPELPAILNSTKDYLLACISGGKDEYSISSYIQQSESAMRIFMKNTNETIIPIAVISPFLCDKTSVEYTLFAADLVKNKKGKPVEIIRGGKTLYVLDIFSKAFRGYLQRQIDILFSIGFCGLQFCDLDVLSLVTKPGKAQGETISFALDYISACAKDKLSIACGAHPTIAQPLFDYNIIGNSVEKTSLSVLDTPSTALDWSFSGFENLVGNFETNKRFPSTLPIAVNCELLTFDPLLFDLCTAANMLIAKGFNLENPTADAMARVGEFAFLSDTIIDDVISIEAGRFAVVFTINDATSVCFFNFTNADWMLDDFTIPALSYDFQE